MNTIYKVLICDRDKEELLGIQWLISKYYLPISSIKLVYHVADLINELESEPPDILCVELDMITKDKWEMVNSFIHQYAKQVIAITAEATFERAMQAISAQAVDLWVKPLNPSQVKYDLQQAVRNLASSSNLISELEIAHGIHYENLFIDSQIPFHYPVYLLETESVEDLDFLRKFVKQFDFYYEPVVFFTSKQIVLIFSQAFSDTFEQAQRLLREWNNGAGGPLAIVVHKKSYEESIYDIYTNLKKIMEMTFFTGFNQVLNTEEAHNWKEIDPFLTVKEQRSWSFMLDEGKGEAIKKYMYETFFAVEIPYPEPGLLRSRLTSIIAQVRRFMIQKGIQSESIERAYIKVFQNVLYGAVLYRIVQDLILFINNLFQIMNEQDMKVDIIDATIAYMEKAYSDANLSLTEVAEYVQRNPSYLSHLLTKKYKQSFSEILLYLRIEKAKELLKTTDEAIQNIAKLVGFNNPNYFSRVFKAHTGKSPRDWRRQ